MSNTKFTKGDKVALIEDKTGDEFIVVEATEKFSRGPVRQYAECRVYAVKDKRDRMWEFREDALEFPPKRKATQTDYKHTCDEVYAEVIRAKSMFPEDFHNQHEGYAVCLEEVDELWEEVKKNQKNYDLAAQRKEAIQAAAMFIRFATELTPLL